MVKATVCFILACLLTFPTYSNSNRVNQAPPATIKLWHKNYDNAYVHDFLSRALTFNEDSSSLALTRVEIASYNEAFAALANETQPIDLIVSGVSKQRENEFLPVYVPISRGLLGFRVCLIEKEGKGLAKINSAEDFKRQELQLGLVDGWPDISVMQDNDIPVQVFATESDLVNKVGSRDFQCFSRSVIEVESDAKRLNMRVEPNIAIIYPYADIIYVHKNATDLHRYIQEKIAEFVASGEFRLFFDSHYASTLEQLNFYERKLIVLNNPKLSKHALEAINRLGIASFNHRYLNN